MAYTALNETYPDGTRTGPQTVADIKANVLALRDMIAANGIATGFNASIGAGSQPEVTQWLYKRSLEWIKVNLTWTSGRVTKSAYYYSADGGSNYYPMADRAGNYVMTLAYDGSGYLATTTWGSTP